MNIYQKFLKLPNFKGKARIQHYIRESFLAPKKIWVREGFWMELDPYDWLQSEILLNGTTEPLTTSLYKKILKPGDVYVDIGSHVGFHTLVARRLVGDNGLVIAVEPQPYNCHKILRNWIANDWHNIDLRVAAAGNRDQIISLNAQKASDSARLSVDADSDNSPNNLSQHFCVPMIRIDSLLGELGLDKIKLLKIDVEGFELEVLEGALHHFNTIENLVLEILTPLDKFSVREKQIMSLLQSYQFNLKNILNEPLDDFSDRNLPEFNLFATKDSF
jgi:FkbM family methyltransferase